MIDTVPPSIALPDAVLGAALDPDDHAPGVEGAEALAGDRAAVEAELGQHVDRVSLGRALVDPGPRDGTGELGAEHPVPGVGRAREAIPHDLAGEHLVGQARERARTPPWAPS